MRTWKRVVIVLGCLIGLWGCSNSQTSWSTCEPGEMADIPAGWFLMGQDNDRRSNQPMRRVYLDAYLIQCAEVTNAEYADYLQASGYEPDEWGPDVADRNPDEPVTGIIWSGAVAYCEWLGYRLPTEAEWEKAARGADGRTYPWGDEWSEGLANTAESGIQGVVAVGSYPQGASPYGLLDMAGNASEWVADYFDSAYYTYAPDRNPTGPDLVLDHGMRGGSWAVSSQFATTFFRNSSHSVLSNPRVGFRCAVSRE